MTPRPLARTRRAGAFVLSLVAATAGVTGLTGCDPRQALYYLQPFSPSVDAPCPSLKGKKVVILTSTTNGVATDFLSLDRELTRDLATILRKEVKKIQIVDTDDVAAWSRSHPTWTDPAEAARAFDADAVIVLEVREYRIQDPSSPGLFEGHSDIHIQVVELDYPKDDRDKPMTDQPKESKIIYDGDRTTAFPVTGHVPAEAGVSATTFRGTFHKLVVKEVSWAFIAHAPGDNIQNTRISAE